MLLYSVVYVSMYTEENYSIVVKMLAIDDNLMWIFFTRTEESTGL